MSPTLLHAIHTPRTRMILCFLCETKAADTSSTTQKDGRVVQQLSQNSMMFTGISKKLQVYTIMLSPFPQSLNTPINTSQTVIFRSSSKLFTSIVMSEMRFCDCIFVGRVICYYYPNRIREPIYDWGAGGGSLVGSKINIV